MSARTFLALAVSILLAVAAATLPGSGAPEPLQALEAPTQVIRPPKLSAEILGSTTTTTTPPPPPTTTTTAAPAPPEPPVVVQAASAPVVAHTEPQPRPAGSCAGWEGMIAAHFPADQVATACRVMMCESGGSPTAENPRSSASGLWQFLGSTWESTTGTPAPASAYSADTQTAAAATLWRSSGWRPWSCY